MKIGKNLKTGLEWSLSSWKSSNDPSSGSIQRLLWTESSAWTILYASPTNECENYGKCGVNGICRLSISSKATLVTCFQTCMLVFILAAYAATDSITPGRSIIDGETLVSSDETFELGFFSPGSSTKRYLGIWYKFSPETVVWIANREAPLLDHYGALNVTKEGTIILLHMKTEMIWSSSRIRTAENPVMQLLDSGNLVVKDGNDSGSANFLWQSFDLPSDTLLPMMKLGKNFITGMNWSLSSWKSPDDPAPGRFTALIDPQGFPQLVVRNGSETFYRGGSWNGERFTGTPDLKQIESANLFKFEFVLNRNEVYYKGEPYPALISRLAVNQSGFLERFVRTKQSQSWLEIYFAPRDECDYYAVCGAYASCNTYNSPLLCTCLDGFEPKYPKEWDHLKWSGGCTRMTTLACRDSVFTKYNGLKLPDTSNSSFDTNMSLKECQAECSKNCSCTAYANSDIRNGGSGCLLWFGGLIDMRIYIDGGQDLYVRMANSTLGNLVVRKNSSKNKEVAIIVIPIILIGLVWGGIVFYLRWKKLTKRDSNKLGQGGFGPVHKGTLPGGQEIAECWVVVRVKRVHGFQGLNIEGQLCVRAEGKIQPERVMGFTIGNRNAAEEPVAQLLDSGSFVVKDRNDSDPESFLWQSFDYPCDTFLPGMKIGRNIVAGLDWHQSSWKSEEDPAPVYDYCGSHASCSTDESPPCNCLEGFVQRPESPGDLVPVWFFYGCIRSGRCCV
ncbi:hypothetical protein V6N11_038658 [Hibiscus sabdariffa]|uniref:Receptor-like serine/threonine-protein kinase n=1 Tax=Hibiscus sabdariffa TaxID=183260 RepID=A0ABR2SKM3_9ROSI